MEAADTGYQWDWHFVGQSLPYLVGGVWTTLYVCAFATILMFPIALLAAGARMAPLWLVRFVGSFYINFFRSTPFLIQLVWIFFALPMVLPIELSPLQASVIGLALYIGAYQAEVVRSGILSLEAGQRAAGLALGMNGWQVYRRIILPQALLRMAPATISVLVILIKESAVVSAVSVTDLMWRSAAIGTRSYRPVEPLVFASLVYVGIILPLTLAARRVHRNIQRIAD
jgi:polar amino acid transport system permease protein